MKYRNMFSILFKILETCQTPVSRTKIMYDSYLSYTQLKEYMDLCMKNNLLIENKNNEMALTTKGGEVFHTIEKLLQMVKN